MEKKFNVGDKVTYLPDDMQGEITAVHSRGLYGVKYPDEDDSFTVNEADLEFVDAKRALGERLCLLGDQFSTERNPIELIKADFADGVSVAYRHTDTTDRKTLFLRQLRQLLREFDASLGDCGIYELEGMGAEFGNGNDRIRWESSVITADNIMDLREE